MRRSYVSPALLVFLGSAVSGAAAAVGCSAVGDRNNVFGDGGRAPTSGAGGNEGGAGGAGGQGTGADGFGGFLPPDGGGASGGGPDVPVNPCGTAWESTTVATLTPVAKRPHARRNSSAVT